ncbi:cytochrome P450 [Daldinia decipiens]|uniref:cytochrome P450 n=1 Tax=Daldinia decipiens TaxID=326647 RepID=UPI0020C42949|nr:cytochrome P450 [Daldinia decipiens]KAI1662760.1 cytochrome P450 [Daldinia decipiens]
MDFEEAIQLGRPSVGVPTMYLVSSLLIIGLYGLYRQLLPKPLPGIPYNPLSASSLLGDGPDMARTVGATGEFGPWCAAQIAKTGAPLCQVFVRPFSRPWVLLADFREAHDILARRTAPARDVDFDKSSFITDSMSCLGEFHAAMRASTREDGFRSNRALMQDLMAPKFLHGVIGPIVHGKGLELVRLLEAKMFLAGERPFSIKANFDCLSLDVMLYFAFMANFEQTNLGPQMELVSRMTAADIPKGHVDEPVTFPETPAGPLIAAVRSAPKVVEDCIASLVPWLNLWWWKKQSWYKKMFLYKYQVLREQFLKALEDYRNGEVRSAAAYMVMREEREAKKHGRAPEFDIDVLSDELFGELIAGNHTTGGALGWLVKCLTSYPHMQANLRESLYAALPQAITEGRPPTFEELRRTRLPYLDAFIEETLRLNPVPVTRETIRDTTILGHPVPKGCQIFLISNGPGFLAPSLAVSASERSPAARETK